MFPWFPFYPSFRSLWSGDVTQDIDPVTNWFSPRIEVFRGDPRIEREVVTKVASYGRQLGLLSNAVLELAEEPDGPAVEKLRALVDQIEEVKQDHKTDLEAAAKNSLEALKEADKAAFERLVATLKT